jgi:aminoglycoside phosphotransferase family enzyme
MSKKKSIRYGSFDYMLEKKREIIKQEAQLNYKDKLKVYLNFDIKELKEMNHPIYNIIKRSYPDIDETLKLDDVRITKLFDNMISLGSTKALELSYKLDGSMSDLTPEPDYDLISEETEGIK